MDKKTTEQDKMAFKPRPHCVITEEPRCFAPFQAAQLRYNIGYITRQKLSASLLNCEIPLKSSILVEPGKFL